ncbi:SPJ_0845 family protein [Lactobacillus sp.]|nr:SPJ_0845 family protein [Lactobacillus sp.]
MGLTFKKNDELEKMLDRFAIIPDDPKEKSKKEPEKDSKKDDKK